MQNRRFFRNLFLCSFVCLGVAGVATGSGRTKNSLRGNVLRVLPSPGIWSGTVESLQWFDLQVVSSRVPDIKPNAILHIGVPLIVGNPLFDQQKRELSKAAVAPGKLLELRFSASCSKSRDIDHYVVEPKCIRVLK